MKPLILLTVIATTVSLWFGARLALAEPSTRNYVVSEGDSCLGIAIRELGSRKAVREIHKLNPKLGSLPHNLTPGMILVLPSSEPATADAQLTDQRGTVQVRKAGGDTWKKEPTGADLYRAWRVGSRDKSSAEITFTDKSMIAMRANTVVVIFGPGKSSSSTRSTATLEEGTLRSRLSELDGNLEITTPSAVATVSTGGALIQVDKKTSKTLVSTHTGKGSVVKGRTKRSKTVTVAPGFGSSIEKGKDPSPPRPLPSTPVWEKAPVFVISWAGTPTILRATWRAVPDAVAYRIEVARDAELRDLLVQVPLPSNVTAFEGQQLAPGKYFMALTAIDAEGFESVPDAARPVELVELQRPAGGVSSGNATTVGLGSTLVAPNGLTCGIGDGPRSTQLVFAQAGTVDLRCGAAGGEAGPGVATVVAPVTATLNGASSITAGATPSSLSISLIADALADGDVVLRVTGQGAEAVTITDVVHSGAVVSAMVSSAAAGSFTVEIIRNAGDISVVLAQVELVVEAAGATAKKAGDRAIPSRVGVFGGVVVGDDTSAGNDSARPLVGIVGQVGVSPWISLDLSASRAVVSDADLVGTIGIGVGTDTRLRPLLRAGFSVRNMESAGGYAGVGLGYDVTSRFTIQGVVDGTLDEDGTRVSGNLGLLFTLP